MKHDISPWRHEHVYLHGFEDSERRTLLVVILTSAMMLAEIVCGWLFNSMAVLADGWHMSTHALALGVGVMAYRFARTNAKNPLYSFGTGKVHALGSFASAVILALVALMVFGESMWKLVRPEPIHYSEALLVAVLGLSVNVVSVFLLQEKPHHHHHDDEGHAHHHHDHNLKAAYAHVIADALTSLLAIAALLLGKYLGWQRVDPLIGIVGACIIANWSWSLVRATATVLLDREADPAAAKAIREVLEEGGEAQLADLHLWHVAPGRLAAIVSLVADEVKPSDYYKNRLSRFNLAHITVEVNQCPLHMKERSD